MYEGGGEWLAGREGAWRVGKWLIIFFYVSFLRLDLYLGEGIHLLRPCFLGLPAPLGDVAGS